jgi:flagellar assembly protein FliH
MTGECSIAPQVLRGLRLEGAPLRLGRARAGMAPAAGQQSLVEEAAQEQALREAHAQAMREGHEEGMRCGRAEGLREGRMQAAEEVRQSVQRGVAEAQAEWKAGHERVHRIAQHAHAALADLLWGAQDEMVALCFETLCRIVGRSAIQPEFVRAQVAHCLAQHGAPAVELHVHPQDAELLQRGSAAAPAVRVIGDPAVALGGCILQAASGALDARLDAMLETCKAALLDARANAVQEQACGEGA